MKTIKWRLGSPVVLLAVSFAADAAMYKCTDAHGKVTFSDKACQEQRQEVVKERAIPPSTEPKPRPEGSTFPQIERIRPLAGGRKITRSSPLAQAYLRFADAVKRCDRNELLNSLSSRFTRAIGAAAESDAELREGCRGLALFLHDDFNEATEVIEGDTGKIQWLSVETTRDRSGTQTSRWEHTEEFVRENGVWKVSGKPARAQ